MLKSFFNCLCENKNANWNKIWTNSIGQIDYLFSYLNSYFVFIFVQKRILIHLDVRMTTLCVLTKQQLFQNYFQAWSFLSFAVRTVTPLEVSTKRISAKIFHANGCLKNSEKKNKNNNNIIRHEQVSHKNVCAIGTFDLSGPHVFQVSPKCSFIFRMWCV